MLSARFSRYMRDVRASRVQTLIFVVAAWFTSNGVGGLLLNHDFPLHATHHAMYMAPYHAFGLIPIAINGWHALFHLFTGVAGLLCARALNSALCYAATTAVIYWSMVAICLAGGMGVCEIMAMDTFAHWVHGTEGLILAVLASYGLTSATWSQERQMSS